MYKILGSCFSPFVRKVMLVLAEKGIQYENEPVSPYKLPEGYHKIHPQGKIPVLKDGDFYLPDSSAIIAYIERQNPNPAIYPGDDRDFGRALWIEEYGDSCMLPKLGPSIYFQKVIGPSFMGRPTDESVVDQAIQNELPPIFDYLESQTLGGQPMVGKGITVADMAMASNFINLHHSGVSVDAVRWPKLADYADFLFAYPTVKAELELETKVLAGIKQGAKK